MTPPSAPSGALWPRMIFIGYALFATALIGFAVFTRGHRMDLVSDDYYADEPLFRQHLLAAERARRLDPPPSLRIDPDARALILTVDPRAWSNAVPAVVSWYRPSNAALDTTRELPAFGPGTTTVDLADMPAGLWNVSVSWELSGEAFHLDGEVILP